MLILLVSLAFQTLTLPPLLCHFFSGHLPLSHIALLLPKFQPLRYQSCFQTITIYTFVRKPREIQYLYSSTLLLVSCIEQDSFPTVFKTAEVVPVFKSGSKQSLNNYRPISLLSEVESKTHGSRPRTQKKIRGQGQPFRGQTLSRPRTKMLEAKDQRHRCKCSPRKKVFKKFFQVTSNSLAYPEFFDWGRL